MAAQDDIPIPRKLTRKDLADIRRVMRLAKEVVRSSQWCARHGFEIGFSAREIASMRACSEVASRMVDTAAKVLDGRA